MDISLSGERIVPSVRAEGQVSALPPVSYMNLEMCRLHKAASDHDLLTEAVLGTTQCGLSRCLKTKLWKWSLVGGSMPLSWALRVYSLMPLPLYLCLVFKGKDVISQLPAPATCCQASPYIRNFPSGTLPSISSLGHGV